MSRENDTIERHIGPLEMIKIKTQVYRMQRDIRRTKHEHFSLANRNPALWDDIPENKLTIIINIVLHLNIVLNGRPELKKIKKEDTKNEIILKRMERNKIHESAKMTLVKVLIP